MTAPKFTLCIVFLFFGKMAGHLKQASAVHQDSGLISANIGHNVTLHCFYGNGTGGTTFSWYKKILGHKAQLVSTNYKYDQNGNLHNEFKDNPRFSLHTAEKGINHLEILDLQLSDSGTYYCVSARSNVFTFSDGAFLSVKGSGSNIQTIIRQAVSESVRLGDSVTLNCTIHTQFCDGEHSVYWFRSSDVSQPGVLYTQGVQNHECKRRSETQTQSCVYNFHKKFLNLSDSGTYYCAVASCGEILYGNGTRIQIVREDECRNQVRILVVLSYIRTGVMLFCLLILTIIYMIRK